MASCCITGCSCQTSCALSKPRRHSGLELHFRKHSNTTKHPAVIRHQCAPRDPHVHQPTPPSFTPGRLKSNPSWTSVASPARDARMISAAWRTHPAGGRWGRDVPVIHGHRVRWQQPRLPVSRGLQQQHGWIGTSSSSLHSTASHWYYCTVSDSWWMWMWKTCQHNKLIVFFYFFCSFCF